jgi:hypothetical protein
MASPRTQLGPIRTSHPSREAANSFGVPEEIAEVSSVPGRARYAYRVGVSAPDAEKRFGHVVEDEVAAVVELGVEVPPFERAGGSRAAHPLTA